MPSERDKASEMASRWRVKLSTLAQFITAACVSIAGFRWAYANYNEPIGALTLLSIVGLIGGPVGWLVTGTRMGFFVGFFVGVAVYLIVYLTALSYVGVLQ